MAQSERDAASERVRRLRRCIERDPEAEQRRRARRLARDKKSHPWRTHPVIPRAQQRKRDDPDR